MGLIVRMGSEMGFCFACSADVVYGIVLFCGRVLLEAITSLLH